jgi:hypothetical protein
VWAGLDSVWDVDSAEARKMPENAADSRTSGARFVSLRFVVPDSLAIKDLGANLATSLHRTRFFIKTQRRQ